MRSALPDKYYLTHAYELFDFVQQRCGHLLDDHHKRYICDFEKLSTDAQCMLVRFLSRKPKFLTRQSLQYAEINDQDAAIAELQNQHYISLVSTNDWYSFVEVLTKQQLLECLSTTKPGIKSSTSKASLVELARSYFKGDEPVLYPYQESFLVRRRQDNVDYILFVFFGDLKNRFQKFAMRDLGVLKTRRSKLSKNNNLIARFATREQSQSAFTMRKLQRDLATNRTICLERMATDLLELKPVGDSAESIHSKLLLELGIRMQHESPRRAIFLWKISQESQALERWVKLTYKSEDRDQLKRELDALRQTSLAAPKRVFIEDFYARKYEGKRTSIYTDMLREGTHVLKIDEAFINEVEQGVVYHYQRRDVCAFFAENLLWRTLFAFTFWDLLFAPTQPQHSEFDRLPPTLKFGQFYSAMQAEIEECLSIFNQPPQVIKRFIKLASEQYGYPTGLFPWTPNVLEMLTACVSHAPAHALTKVLRQMAMDYDNCKDGYPDLMVLDNSGLRFEEIKAAGDVLRPNQLLSIRRLRDAGFSVDVTQVTWTTDPNQVYAVVDIETTGGKKGLHSITEIAIVKVCDHKIISKWSTLVNPQRTIPRHITNLTGIDNHMVKSAPIFAEVVDQLLAELKGCIFVAHNVGFDYSFIKTALEELNRPFHMPKYCTVRNARKAFPGLKSYALGKLTHHFDIELDQAHRALDDALATAKLLVLIQQQRALIVTN